MAYDKLSSEKQLQNCSFCKTILMVIIVFYHSCVFWTNTWLKNTEVVINSDFFNLFSKYLDTFHVYGFTLISGYIFYYIKFEKNGYSDFKKFVFKKFQRLIIPYGHI